MKNAVFWWEKVQKWLYNQGGHNPYFCEVFSLHSIVINRVFKRDFISLIFQYIILDKSSLWTGNWGRWRDLIAMYHFGWTDGLFSGSKGLEIVQLLCGQCFSDCYKHQTYVTTVAIFKDCLSSNNLNRKRSIISFIVQIIAIFAVWTGN